MNSRLTTPHGRHILNRLAASGLPTNRSIRYWIEGLLAHLGLPGVERLMKLLVAQSRHAGDPSAWMSWASTKQWTGLVDDAQIRFVHNGPPEARKPQDCGVASISVLLPGLA